MVKTNDKLVLTDKDGCILSKVTTENDALTLVHVNDLYLQDECEPLVFDNIWDANRVRTNSANKMRRLDDLEIEEYFLNLQITKLKKVFKKNPHLSKPDLKAYFERISTDHPVMRGGSSRESLDEVERGGGGADVPTKATRQRREAPVMPLKENGPSIPIAPEMPPEPVHRPLTEVEQTQASILSRALGSDPDMDF